MIETLTGSDRPLPLTVPALIVPWSIDPDCDVEYRRDAALCRSHGDVIGDPGELLDEGAN